MDDPSLDPAHHVQALRGLARINALSRAAYGLYKVMRPTLQRFGPDATLLDVASGDCSVSLALHQRAREDGFALRIIAVDKSEVALGRARVAAADAGAPLQTLNADATAATLPTADIVLCTLFLHHLPTNVVTSVLRAMQSAARRLLLISDLRRCATGTALAAVIPRVVSRSSIVHTDAVRSVRAAFTIAEIRDLARSAGLSNAIITPVFPARFQLHWTRENA